MIDSSRISFIMATVALLTFFFKFINQHGFFMALKFLETIQCENETKYEEYLELEGWFHSTFFFLFPFFFLLLLLFYPLIIPHFHNFQTEIQVFRQDELNGFWACTTDTYILNHSLFFSCS